MTREEAIAFFKDMNECTYGNLEAVEMAIKALEAWEDEVEESAIFDADERADIMNAINDKLDDMGYVAVGYDDTNGVWMDVFIQKQ